ncbi:MULTISPECIES: cation diffusion facilitator family transporter [Gordonia]|uniref:cation diffusion facilitator family transporter n=1 Tax=Gordonia TaxID=2053 RepID=UPI0004AFF45A|nr:MULTISPECIES: cation diffusion facilitator family transporter [Gordonia]AZZ81645.1 cation transporter [Gordonia alkanivorans]MDH3020334.1 cation diffusion facilitator family transporter [Gordonia alkanivorans]MDH3023904.1 cation diffusion facilitator family transporter [Gordonia alkanivorans]MDJ0006449.1 cation diffusion facilitator family transporter [Gordonia alkanivorans]MDJ0097130.1 cation diffusion facilitator family transporter [Gordonia alkanivorans]
MTRGQRHNLARFAVLSIVTAVVVFGLKLLAWWITGSVGLLSDALESIVNVVAAVGAFVALRVAAKPPDRGHNFGHTKAEYFSAVFEGVLIVVAAVIIVVTAIDRLINPRELEEVGLGLGISVGATALNAAVGLILIRAGRKHRSLTLEADGKHLMTDVATTVGVLVGVFLVALTGWLPLDPLIAIAVAINIMVVGTRLVWRSSAGLMDSALPAEQRSAIDDVLDRHRTDGIVFHDIRTREAGHERFLQLHMLVPGDWSVQRAHDLTEVVEDDLHAAVPDLNITTHVEPVNDPRAYEDWRLE